MRNLYLILLFLFISSISFADNNVPRSRRRPMDFDGQKNYFEIKHPAPTRIWAQPDEIPVWIEPLFGPEFTFSKENINELNAFVDMCVRCREHLIDNQPEGAKFSYPKEVPNFKSPNGWDFTVNTDSGVVEVQMKPMTAGDFKKYKNDIQDAIFASAANVNLVPYLFRGGGHINISWDTFSENMLLLRNFLVDMYNHNELVMGVFSYDTRNALPIQQADESILRRFKGLISMIDRGEIRTFDQVRQHLGYYMPRRDVFIHRLTLAKAVALSGENISTLDPAERRFEIRAVRPQASADVFVRQISLLRDRIHYLYKLNKPLELKLEVKMNSMDIEAHTLNPPIDAQEALRAFYKYVHESGHRWSDHRDYLWPNWITSGELTKFESSEWFREQEAKTCVGLLTAAST